MSPMLRMLIVKIDRLFKTDPNSRVLIFLEKRTHCETLATLVGQYTRRQTSYLTGNESAEKSGLKEKGQRDTLRDFKSGRISILCCTSVGDEGLDIPECKLVIKYNYVTNAIAHVQRRGRGRAVDTRSILLAESNDIEEREQLNIKKEKMMSDALRFIDLDLFGFFSKVEDKIVANKDQRDKERLASLLQEQTRAHNPQDVYVMICRTCVHQVKMNHQIVGVTDSLLDRLIFSVRPHITAFAIQLFGKE